MNHSFRFIVNPNSKDLEITSLLQYCALKNTLSELTSNNIKSLKFNENPVLFADMFTRDKQCASFTEYIKKNQSEKNDFKTEILKEDSVSLFFNAISEIDYAGSFVASRSWNSNSITLNDYTVDDLYTIFMNHEHAKKYLLKYIPKNSEDICYALLPDANDKSNDIVYDDGVINFYIIGSGYKDKKAKEEYIKLVNYVNENIDFQIFKNNGHIENTYDDLCVYTEDPTIIHKVLMNNQSIIDTMASNIFYIKHRLHSKDFYKFNVYNELQTSIENVVETYETTKKEVEDKLAVLNDLFN